jgi:hypothetical protein
MEKGSLGGGQSSEKVQIKALSRGLGLGAVKPADAKREALRPAEILGRYAFGPKAPPRS